jgi:2-polyprenyl-3-methyl-5-hydroxy-6-metoxy-1,4-benzoquinol methylase
MTEAAWVEAVDKYYKRSETFAGGLEAFLWPARKTSLAGLKVLEVGCGGGWYLNSCRLRGAEVRGFDPDANCIKAGRERGIDISNGLSEDALAAGASADVVMLIHVLEHTLEPVEVLKTARQLLRNDGCLFVAVPGLKSVATGAWGGSLKLQIQGAHNYIWHRSPFERMAAAAGLSIVNWNDSIWCVMVPASSSSGCANIRQEPGTLQLLLTLRLAGLYWEFISRRFGPTSATYSVSQRLASLVARRTGLCKS